MVKSPGQSTYPTPANGFGFIRPLHNKGVLERLDHSMLALCADCLPFVIENENLSSHVAACASFAIDLRLTPNLDNYEEVMYYQWSQAVCGEKCLNPGSRGRVAGRDSQTWKCDAPRRFCCFSEERKGILSCSEIECLLGSSTAYRMSAIGRSINLIELYSCRMDHYMATYLEREHLADQFIVIAKMAEKCMMVNSRLQATPSFLPLRKHKDSYWDFILLKSEQSRCLLLEEISIPS